MSADMLRAALRRDLTAAMRARDAEATAALRTAIAAIDNAEAVPAPAAAPVVTSAHIAGAQAGFGTAEAARRQLTTAELTALLRVQLAEYETEAASYAALGRPEAAARLRR